MYEYTSIPTSSSVEMNVKDYVFSSATSCREVENVYYLNLNTSY